MPALKNYRVNKFNFTNTLNGSFTLKLETKYSYNVKYAPNNICRAELSVNSCDREHPDDFSVSAEIIGIFEAEPDKTKEDLHVECFNQLFPILRAIVLSNTANYGVPPVMLPAIDISNQEIYRFDLQNGKNQNPSQ